MGNDAGKLRTRITIQERQTGQDNAGQPTTSWNDLTQTWARVQSVKGSEDFKGQQLSPEVDYRVTTRRMPAGITLNPRHRIVFTDDDGTTQRYLEILFVNSSERAIDDMLMVQCKERIDWTPGN